MKLVLRSELDYAFSLQKVIQQLKEYANISYFSEPGRQDAIFAPEILFYFLIVRSQHKSPSRRISLNRKSLNIF